MNRFLMHLPSAHTLGRVCIWGALVGAGLALLNTIAPNSAGSTAQGNFVVLVPWLHRLEHLVAALVVFPALGCGLVAYQRAGLGGKQGWGWFITAVGALSVLAISASSLVEAVVLQSDAADEVRGYAIAVLLVLTPALLGLVALLARAAPLGARLWPLGLVLLVLATGWVGSQMGRWEPLAVGAMMLGWAAFGLGIARQSGGTGADSLDGSYSSRRTTLTTSVSASETTSMDTHGT